ncbi:MAG: type II toxin-antitoxin system HicB family antitoxin [Oscillospiraceae bacterium]|nr:type II toxin-antitoxin system HicB family antitoxin [Oscillospiraceae bacterium]
MKQRLAYKGYSTIPEFSIEDEAIIGKIEGISDLVSFESESTSSADIEAAFHEAVDDYLEMCRAVGKSPDKEYRGSFNVRISPELHRSLDQRASREDISLNQAVEDAIKFYLEYESFEKRGEEYSSSSNPLIRQMRSSWQESRQSTRQSLQLISGGLQQSMTQEG